MEQMESRNVEVNIEDEMKRSYMDYAMSVIIGRALPKVEDGLKPVHRRILYSMFRSGLLANKKYSKCAKVVGEVLGKYHPHGDTAVYDALVRLAQDFNMRYPLVDGQGNFGSIDGDSAAAYRYTEARLTRLSEELLRDIDRETVDFSPNFDETTEEPLILPTVIPNLLINGSSGIAVGMATNIPPHNLGEVLDGAIALIKKPEITPAELIQIIPGPDFPTAGFIHGRRGMQEAYTTGKGSVKMRAKASIEIQKRTERESIIVTEIPYQVNKARLIEKIAELVRHKKIDGISDLRDESDKDGMRIVIEIKKDRPALVVLNQLYKHTQMQSNFGIAMLAIVSNQPKLLNLKDYLELFRDHRVEVVRRRTIFNLKKAEERSHILEGFKIALDNIDAVIKLIRKSKTPPEAKDGLMIKFELSAIQAQAILEMRLQRLTGMEREKILDELNQIKKLIKELEGILSDEIKVLKIIVDELTEIKDKYADPRRTQIVDEAEEIGIEDLIVEEDMVVTTSLQGYIKRNPVTLYRAQRRGGRGKAGMGTKEEDIVKDLFVASTHDYILVFTSRGRVHWLKVYLIPQVGRAAKGKAIVNLLQLGAKEEVRAILPVKEFEEGKFIVMATKKGIIKKTELKAYSRPRAGGIIAINIDEDDDLISASITDGEHHIFLGTSSGMSIRFKEEQVRPMGRGARGVKGIKLKKKGDFLKGMEVLTPGATILTATENGFGKRTKIEEYRLQSRGGSGVITIKTTARNGPVVGVMQVTDDDQVMIITKGGKIIRMRMNEVRAIGRNTQGVKLINLGKGEKVMSITKLAEKDDEEENGNGNGEEEVENPEAPNKDKDKKEE